MFRVYYNTFHIFIVEMFVYAPSHVMPQIFNPDWWEYFKIDYLDLI